MWPSDVEIKHGGMKTRRWIMRVTLMRFSVTGPIPTTRTDGRNPNSSLLMASLINLSQELDYLTFVGKKQISVGK